MIITLSLHILHDVDPMVRDLTMINLSIRAHLLIINRHIVDVAVVDSGGVDILHLLLIRGRLSIDAVPRGGAATGEEAATIRI